MNYFNYAEITLDEMYDLWNNNYNTVPMELSCRVHQHMSFQLFCDYMKDRFKFRII